MLNIDAAVAAAISAVYESSLRYPYLLILRNDEDGTFTASTWEQNTTPAEVHDNSPDVLFWDKVPTLDFKDLFTTASEWDIELFREECEKHAISPEDGWEAYNPSEFPGLAERLWYALSDDERAEHCRTFWDYHDMPETIRQSVEERVLEDLKATLEPGEKLWLLATGADNQDAVIVAMDWQEAANEACFEHDSTAWPAHWRIRSIE
jgi:hypothetical protein